MADDPKKVPSTLGKKVRTQIQQTIDQQTDERRRDLFKQRLELARQGVGKYQDREAGKSAMNFQSYIRILEDWKGVPEGSLRPSHFDPKKEEVEILLLSGVYWDLVKLFDRTKSEEKRKLFLHYLSQYIVFSKGLPHQQLSAETIRKYVTNGKPVHVEDFRNAYRALNKSKCFVASELFELVDDEAFEAWRDFRDRRLAVGRFGRAWVGLYYAAGPVVAAILSRSPRVVRRVVAGALNRFVPARAHPQR